MNIFMHTAPRNPGILAGALLSSLLVLPPLLEASDWRVHLGVCNQNRECARQQAAARDLWDKQSWSPDLKESCRKQFIQVYSKDYIGAVSCVKELEEQRQEFEMKQAEIDRKRNEHKTYRTWGGIIVR